MNLSPYRPDIDGLRAIAILSVVAFHLHVPGLSGGFTGVDVFFVISGYLITRMLVDELTRTQRISVLDFYARRVRRLFPALVLMIGATLVAGYFFLSPVREQQDLATSALATAGFVSNIFFWRTQTGYFAPDATFLPLLHTWSLAVEEQFYIFWPLLLVWIGRIARHYDRPFLCTALVIVGATTVASFAIGWALSELRPTAAFYLAPCRAFELGCGALVAIALYTERNLAPRHGQLLSGTGLFMIGLGFVSIDAETPFPAFVALLPVTGAALTIAGGALAPTTLANRLLSWSPMVWIGKLSYSWYLWHWPMLAFGRANALGQPDPFRDVVLATTALGLSALTYWFIEKPVRELRLRSFYDSKSAVRTGGFMLVGIALAAGSLILIADLQLKGDPYLSSLATTRNEKFSLPIACEQFRHPYVRASPIAPCLVGARDAPTRYVLWGDSNAHHYLPAIDSIGVGAGMSVLPRTMGGCQPIAHVPGPSPTGAQAVFREDCERFNADVLSTIRELRGQGLEGVILGGRWGLPSAWQAASNTWGVALRDNVRLLSEAGLRVVIVANTPDFEASVPICLARRAATSCGRSRTRVIEQRAAAMAVLRNVAQSIPNVTVWDPLGILCDAETCSPVRGDKILYSDHQHLSIAGALLLQEGIAGVLRRRHDP